MAEVHIVFRDNPDDPFDCEAVLEGVPGEEQIVDGKLPDEIFEKLTMAQRFGIAVMKLLDKVGSDIREGIAEHMGEKKKSPRSWKN